MMRIPGEIQPYLEHAARMHKLPLEMWTSEDGYRIIDGFLELGAQLRSIDIDLTRLPKGYGMLAILFGWEAECQFEGWNAFEWTEDPHSVMMAYADIGLASEAHALGRAWKAWQESDGDHERTSEAYIQGDGQIKSEEERLEYLAAYFCSHADELFYETDTRG